MKNKAESCPACELDLEFGLPRNMMPVPAEKLVPGIPRFYCCDSRKEDCPYSLIINGEGYCEYNKENKKLFNRQN